MRVLNEHLLKAAQIREFKILNAGYLKIKKSI